MLADSHNYLQSCSWCRFVPESDSYTVIMFQSLTDFEVFYKALLIKLPDLVSNLNRLKLKTVCESLLFVNQVYSFQNVPRTFQCASLIM